MVKIPENFEPVDVIVFLLAGVIGLVFFVTGIRVITHGPLGTEEVGILSRIIVAIIAVISLYVGARLNIDRPKDKDGE